MGLKDLFGKKKTQSQAQIQDENKKDVDVVVSKEKQAEKVAGEVMGKMDFSKMDPSKGADINSMLDMVDTSKLTTMQKMGLKMFKKLPQSKQEKIMRQAFNPKEIYKNKDKMKEQIDEMVKAGMIDKSQAEAVKSQMGIR